MLSWFIIPAVIAAVGGLAAAGINYASQQSANTSNQKMQASANASNERLTREAWERDDTAVQRRAMDLAEAGLSPHLAAGSAADTSGPINVHQASRDTAPQISNPLAGVADTILQAGQLDLASKRLSLDAEAQAYQNRYVHQQIAQSEMYTKYLNRQLVRQDLLDTLAAQKDAREIQMQSAVLENMGHNLGYARQNNLPVGAVQENQIRRIEFVLDKMGDLWNSTGIPSFLQNFPKIPDMNTQELSQFGANSLLGIGRMMPGLGPIYGLLQNSDLLKKFFGGLK